MARTVKNENSLFQEEKLVQALVPEGEQPYQVPKNWCWVVQGQVSTFFNGRAYKQAELLEDETKTPVLRVGNLFTNTSWYYSDLKLDENKYIDNEDLIYAWSASFGPFIWQGGKAIYHYHIWKVELTSALKKEYYYFWLLNDTERLKKQGHGTGMIHVTKEMMENSAMPLPPLAEQQRIVDRIESLFAKLDEAKEKAQDVVDGFEDRRAAILYEAFTGKLTEEWRRDNGISKESWEPLRFDDCVDVMQNGIAKRNGDTGEPYVVLRLANLSDDGFDETELRKIVLDEKEQRKYELHFNDVLMVRVNGSKDNVGKQYRITNQKRWAFCDHIIRIKYVNSIVPQYMVYFSKSEAYRQYIKDNMVSSAGQNTISRKGIARLQIPMPQYDEQEQIVSILSNLFEKEQQAKEAAEQVIDQIDTMKKSILARACRGELGTNDPNDESAVELLKRVLCDDVPAPQRAKPITIPKELASSLQDELEKKIVKLYFQKETKVLPVKEIMGVSSKTFDILDCLRSLQNRQIIIKQEDGYYKLMG